MAFISFHAGTEGKIRRNDIRAMSGHTFRKSDDRYKTHSNENIKHAFTDFNLDWFKGDAKNIEQAVDERLKSYSGKRALRKDAVILREVIVQLSPEEFNTGDVGRIYDDREKALKFTDDMVDVLKSEWGEENILGYSVHMDESNPHAHILMMPMTDDGRLSQKDFFKGPGDLKRQHRAIREKMADKGWNVENENKYIDVDGFDLPTYKRNAVKIDELRQKQTDDMRNLKTPELIEDAKQAFIAQFVEDGMMLAKQEQQEEEERLEAKRADIERREMTLLERLEELDRRDAEVAEKTEENRKILYANRLVLEKTEAERDLIQRVEMDQLVKGRVLDKQEAVAKAVFMAVVENDKMAGKIKEQLKNNSLTAFSSDGVFNAVATSMERTMDGRNIKGLADRRYMQKRREEIEQEQSNDGPEL